MNWTDTWQGRGNAYNHAMILFPNAREEERRLLMKPLKLKPEHELLEVAPSGSAFFSVGVKALLGADFCCRAVEPAEEHAQALPDFMKVIEGSSFSNFMVPSHTFDRIANLAGLHHSSDDEIKAFFSESWRCLKPNGILGAADVRKGGGVDTWLNDFVNDNNPKGHDGHFFAEGDLSTLASEASFTEIEERTHQFTWDFPSEEGMVTFCKTLFFLEGLSNEKILEAIRTILGYSQNPDASVSMNWELIYCFGKK